MDATEVTVATYRVCVEQRGCKVPRLFDVNSNYRFEREDHPVNMVDLDQALFFCQSLGKTVPTEAQWVWAAGHGDGRKYPWGNEPPTCENARADFTPGGAPKSTPAGNVGCRGGNTSPVGSYPAGKSSWPDGDLYDMGGNVWEWTRDCSLPFDSQRQTDPNPSIHPVLQDRCWVYALVGGGWNRSATALEVGWRAAARRNYQVPGLGFRCVRDPD
jgi:formylglycine-generating enzyme required for sulfatase activity